MVHELGYNESRGYLAVFIAWVLAQTIKIIIGIVREKRFNFRWLVTTGGFPSTHTAAVAALSTVVGFYYGVGSIIFEITVVFTLIIMFDAAGVRRAVGKQASVLNHIIDDIYAKGEITETRLKELLGHTPLEVFSGAALGIVVALLLH
jgi:uncharacterized protein